MSELSKVIRKESSFFFAVPALVWQTLFLYIPLAFLMGLSIVRRDAAGVSCTLDHYCSLVSSEYVSIFFRSLFTALVTGFTCLLVAYPVAYYIAFVVRRFKNVLLLLFVIPFWTNFLVQVYAWFFVLEQRGLVNSFLLKLGLIKHPIPFLNSYAAIWLVMVYCYLPFMIMPLYNVLEKLSNRLLEASRDLGADTRQTFLGVTLPLSFSGIKTGFFLVFVAAFGELAIPALLGGNKHVFVASLISHYFLVVRNSGLGAAFTVISCIVLSSSIVGIIWLMRRVIMKRRLF